MPRNVTVWVASLPGRPHLSLQWYDPITGKRRTRSTKTSDQDRAEQMRADLEYEFRHGTYAEPRRMPWAEFVTRYVEERMVERRGATRYKSRRVLLQFGAFGRVNQLADANEDAIGRYVAKLHSQKRKAATIAGNLAYIRSALRWAVRRKWLPSAPAFEMPKLPRRRHIRVITDDEWQRILANAGGDWTLLLHTAWYTGMRRGELVALRWNNDGQGPWVDLDAEMIWIPAAWTKSDADSWLPIHPTLKMHLLAARKPSGKCFKMRHDAADASKDFARICRFAGVRGVTLHDIRRTFGTRYASLVPAQVLQRLMRHASISTTLRYYANLDGGLAEAIRKAG